MAKTAKPKAGVYIRLLRARGRYVRDILHIDPETRLEIDRLDVEGDVGGDVVNVRRPKRGKQKKKRRLVPGRIRKLITHTALGALSIGGAVTAAGLAHAMGWG
ncbi:MAG: hypothetical protein JSS00_00070 [Proteobacteria bacterium]|nr:hypothetical protein [Pseudomonadota bacterium]